MIDVFEVARILVAHAVRTHGEQIDVIGYYGSYAQGVATARSDLDIFYIPAEGANPPVNRAVLIDGILFDFWPITWDTMEGFATGRRRGWAHAPALVFFAKTLYCRSDEAALRLAGLQQQVADLQRPEARPQMVERARAQFERVCTHLGELRLALSMGHLTDVRQAGWEVISTSLECLALANQVFFNRSGSTMLEELSRLQARPAGLVDLITTISTAVDARAVAEAAEALALGTRHVLRQCQTPCPPRRTAQDQFRDAYPEIRAGLDKVLSACEKQQPIAASAAACSIQREVAQALAELDSQAAAYPGLSSPSEYAARYREIDLPDLMSDSFSDLQSLAGRVRLFDRRLRQWLTEQSVALNEYRTVEEFARSLG